MLETLTSQLKHTNETIQITVLSSKLKKLTSTFWAVVKITSFSDKDIDCITNTPLSNLRNLESNEINLHNAKNVQSFLSQTLMIHGTAQGKGRDHLYSSLPFPPAHGHSDIHLQLCMCDD